MFAIGMVCILFGMVAVRVSFRNAPGLIAIIFGFLLCAISLVVLAWRTLP